jgi:uncharacterized membrane protein YphA (DoxX/SURF4 family)
MPTEPHATAPQTLQTRAAEALATKQEAEGQRATAGLFPTEPVPGGQASSPEAPRRLASRRADPAVEQCALPRVARDIVLLLARLVVGVVFLAHGLQKLSQGVAGTAEGFGQMGIPLPELSAVFAMAAEINGGALLLAAVGPGRISLDSVPARRRRAR